MQKDWIHFWQSENTFCDRDWISHIRIFLKKSEKYIGFNKDDVVLDIGCGAGFLAKFLNDKVKEIHCLDTSEKYLQTARQNNAGNKNVHFYLLGPERYTDISVLPNIKFTKILCLSVVQYYNHRDEVKALIKHVQQKCSTGSKFLIADILAENNIKSNLLGVLLSQNTFTDILHNFYLLIRLIFSNYSEYYKKNGLLTISVQQLNEMIAELKIKANIIYDQITLNKNRLHLLISF